MWFRNRQDEGVVYDSYFQPIKVETVALILTVVSVFFVYKIYYSDVFQIECCIDEWTTGIRTDCAFTTAAYRDIYVDHLRCLQDFISHDKKYGKDNIVGNIIEKLYNRGRLVLWPHPHWLSSLYNRFHAGAQPVSHLKTRTISTTAFNAAIKEYEGDSNSESDGETGDMSN